MKKLPTPLACLFFCVPIPLNAQDAAPAASKPSLDFLGKAYTLGEASRSKGGAKNIYYLAGDSPKRWIQRISYSLHPGQKDINKAMQAMIDFYKKGKHETEAGRLSTPRVVSFYAYERHPEFHQFSIHCLHHGANGKGVIVRTYNIKNLPKNEQAFRAQIRKAREGYLSKLASAKFPRFVLAKPAAPAMPASPANGKPPALRTIVEKVNDIQGKGKFYTIDEAFATNNGAKGGDHRPFTVVIPPSKLGKAIPGARPDVVDIARFSLVSEDGKLLESIRFFSLNSIPNVAMDKRLERIAATIEAKMVSKFFSAHKEGKIGMRYRTKVGPYDAACLLGRMTASDGTMLYIKFVALLAENEKQGIGAVMLLNPTGDKPENVKNRLQNGFAQQVLHSVLFKK